MRNKNLFYGILIVIIVLIGVSFFWINKNPIIPESENKIIVKQSGGAGMLIAECMDRNYISNTADYIIEGTVEKVEIKWNEEKTNIFTYTELKIEKYIKGASFAEDKLQIVTPGGTVGEISQWTEDQPISYEGNKIRIYFQKTNEDFSIVCAQFGVEELDFLPTANQQS